MTTDVDGPESGRPVEIETRSADETRELGKRLARLLEPGDVVVLSGELGAGKTTLAQGLGAGLEVRGDVTSPTFVISRVHPSLADGPPLVHVDAYRLHGGAELDDLDLDETLEFAVTVLEWGDGLADSLSPDRIRVQLRRMGSGYGLGLVDESRSIIVQGFGSRWAAQTWDALTEEPDPDPPRQPRP